jgi:hypothetical protein
MTTKVQNRYFRMAAMGALALSAVSAFAQQYPNTQYPPPPQGQYPPPGQGQYPPQQGQYPPPQGQYPPPQGQYPPPQGQYSMQQPNYGPPPMMAPQQLDQLVGPIALYPDGLLAQVLSASTFGYELPDAANWSNNHSYLRGEQLAAAIREDNLPWDPSVLALLPFPSVIAYMAQNMQWTQQLGTAVLAQRNDVMDAIQNMRAQSYQYGYLRPNQYENVVDEPGAIQIVPVDPALYYVPVYDPGIVFFAPRPGFFVGGGIRFGFGISIGAAFAPWGWGGVGFGWRDHTILVDHRPWGRTWSNQRGYVHPYAAPYRAVGPRGESHQLHELEHHGNEHERH